MESKRTPQSLNIDTVMMSTQNLPAIWELNSQSVRNFFVVFLLPQLAGDDDLFHVNHFHRLNFKLINYRLRIGRADDDELVTIDVHFGPAAPVIRRYTIRSAHSGHRVSAITEPSLSISVCTAC